MPFKSEAQRRLFWAKVNRGEIKRSVAEEWESATPKGKKLPYKLKKAMLEAFVDELSKIAMAPAPGTLQAATRLRGPIGEMVRGWMGVGGEAGGALGRGVKSRLRMVEKISPENYRMYFGRPVASTRRTIPTADLPTTLIRNPPRTGTLIVKPPLRQVSSPIPRATAA